MSKTEILIHLFILSENDYQFIDLNHGDCLELYAGVVVIDRGLLLCVFVLKYILEINLWLYELAVLNSSPLSFLIFQICVYLV